MICDKVVPLFVPLNLNMIGLGNMVEGILAGCFIVGFHVIVECFLIAEMPVELKVVVGSEFC